MDLDLRRVRYFLAVAEQLNFSRAAEALHIAQPVLSRQIKVLETELGVDLFTREKKRTALTNAGSVLLEEAPALLAAASAARRRVGLAARGAGTFTVGFARGITISESVQEMRRRHPDLQVEVILTQWHNQVELILDGRIDIGYTRLPINPAGLEVVPLFEEPRVILLPRTHSLAAEDRVSPSDLVAEHLVQDPSGVPEWRTIAREMRAGGHPDHRVIRSMEERLEMVASGQGVMIIPRSAALFYRRPDVVVLPLEGFDPNRVGLVWDGSRDSRLFWEFVAIAKENAVDPWASTGEGSSG